MCELPSAFQMSCDEAIAIYGIVESGCHLLNNNEWGSIDGNERVSPFEAEMQSARVSVQI